MITIGINFFPKEVTQMPYVLSTLASIDSNIPPASRVDSFGPPRSFLFTLLTNAASVVHCLDVFICAITLIFSAPANGSFCMQGAWLLFCAV